MVCPKCNAKLDDDSRFCKFCGAAATDTVAPRLTNLTKKQRGLFILLPGVIGIVSLICGMIMWTQYDPFATIGMVLIYIGGILCVLLCLFAFFHSIFTIVQARADKEAQRDKLMQDMAKKLEDLENFQKQ